MATIGAVATAPLRARTAGERSGASIAFLVALWLAVAFAMVCLVTLLVTAFVDGYPRLDSNLFTQYTSNVFPEKAGARAAIIGSMWVIGTTALLAIPLGISAAVYLEEFADSRRWYNRLIEVNLQNLAAVPAIVYGMLTAGFALAIGLERRVVLVRSDRAVAAHPPGHHHHHPRSAPLRTGRDPARVARAGRNAACRRCGSQTLPSALPGVATGTILALSRALGEAAPLLLLGGAVFISYDPNGLLSGFTTLPIQIFSWTGQPQEEFQQVASAAIIVLLGLLLLMNALAIVIRNRYQRHW